MTQAAKIKNQGFLSNLDAPLLYTIIFYKRVYSARGRETFPTMHPGNFPRHFCYGAWLVARERELLQVRLMAGWSQLGRALLSITRRPSVLSGWGKRFSPSLALPGVITHHPHCWSFFCKIRGLFLASYRKAMAFTLRYTTKTIW